MISYKNSYQIVTSSTSHIREDHYDGVNAIYRLSACIPIPKHTSPDGVRRQLKRLIKDLSVLNVQANRINVFDDILEIDFYPKGFQMVMNKSQYLGLQLEFAQFLEESGIPGILIQDGCYNDDPEDSVTSVSNDLINFFPEFNSNCFGIEHNRTLEFTNCTLVKEYREVVF